MLLKNTLIRSLLIFACFVFISCNAPHINPLDPFSEGLSYATIKGVVQNYGATTMKVPDVSIYWEPQKVLVKSDSGGNFLISNVFPTDGKLTFHKDGYMDDTLSIKWDNNKVFSDTVRLKKIPQIENLQFYSVNVLSLDSTSFSELYLQVKLNSADKNVDSLFVTSDEFNFSKGLTLNASGNFYHAEIKKDDLGVPSLEQVVGYDFEVYAVDSLAGTYLVGTTKIFRIIKNYPRLSEPNNNDTLNVTPALKWQNYSGDFQYTYGVEIYNDVFPGFSPEDDYFYLDSQIPSNTIEDNISKTLVSGDYYWVVWVVDNFGDRISSFPYKFHIE